MAPEVILENAIDQRADIYALGCVVYYLLTGQLVFDADTPMRMFVEHLQTRPTPPSVRSELPIPPEVDAIVMACLEKDPARRPQNVEALLRLLDGYRPPAPWTNELARQWWDRHLVDLAAPVSPSDAPTIATIETLAVA